MTESSPKKTITSPIEKAIVLSRAKAEGQHWAEEKAAKVEARLNQMLLTVERQRQIMEMPDESLVAGIERWYSAAQTARFFGRSTQWIYDRFSKGRFCYKDGTPIIPVYAGGIKKPRMRFNLDLIRAMGDSCHRDGIASLDELTVILRRVAMSEVGEIVYDDDQ